MITSPFQLSFWLYFIYFFFAVFVAFYIPGKVLLRKINLPISHALVLSMVLGMALWGWQGFVFGFLHVRWLPYVYLLVFFLLFIKSVQKPIRFPRLKIKYDPLLTGIITIGSLMQLAFVLLTGIKTPEGIFFCCGAVGDNLYHLNLVFQVLQQIPPYEPDMAGVAVTNYHYFAHIVIAELVRVFGLPLVHTQSQFLPLLLSPFLGILAIIFCNIVKVKRTYTAWLLFFLYFGGDWIYLLILLLGRGLNFSMGPLENGAALLNNLPRGYAIVTFFAGLSFFLLWTKTQKLFLGIIMAILFSSLIGYKVYIGLFALSGLGILGIYYVFRKSFSMLFPILLTFLLTLILYLPVNKNSGGLFFTGFWRFEEFIVQPALGLSHLELARVIFLQHSNFLRAFVYDLIFMGLFTITIFGPKLFGIWQSKKSLSLFPKELNIFLISALVINTIVGFFSQQVSGGSNSFNFLVTVYIIGSIYTALFCYYFLPKLHKFIKIACIALIILGTIPRIGYEEYKNVRMFLDGGVLVSNSSLEAYAFLQQNTKQSDIVMVSHTGYFVFLGQRPIFLGNVGILESHTIDITKRKRVQDTILQSTDATLVKKELANNNISYLLLPTGLSPKSTDSAKFLKKVFSNEGAKILKVL